MIVVIVRFSLAIPMSLDEATQAFERSAPSYQSVAGLLGKRFLLSEDGATAGGVYQWTSKARAEEFYDAAWSARIAAKYGAAPTIEYFHSPVGVTPPEVAVELSQLRPPLDRHGDRVADVARLVEDRHREALDRLGR